MSSGGYSGAGGNAGAGGSVTTSNANGGSAGEGGTGGADPGVGGSAGSAGTLDDGSVEGGTGGTTIDEGGSGGASMGGGSGTGGSASVPDASGDTGAPDGPPPRDHPVCAVRQCKLVFVTSRSYGAAAGSAVSFDRICQQVAESRNLAGVYMAWVSDRAGSVSSRMSQATVPYRLLDGSTIARDWPDLTVGRILHPINVREDGTTLSAGVDVWTGTLAGGNLAPFYCNNWTTTQGVGMVGSSDVTSEGWTYAHQQYCSMPTVHLYCFEQ